MSDPGVPAVSESITVTADRGTIKPKRNIGGLIANVVVEEVHNDEMAITQHPVEKTADISDHAYPLPVTLTVRIAYSPSGSGVGGGDPQGDIPDEEDPTPLQTIYEQYLALQKGRELLEVQTGKRLYENMLIKTLALTTDKDTENALYLTVGLQEIILVETQTVTVPPNNVQAAPAKTGNTLNGGTKQATPAPTNYNAQGVDQLPTPFFPGSVFSPGFGVGG